MHSFTDNFLRSKTMLKITSGIFWHLGLQQFQQVSCQHTNNATWHSVLLKKKTSIHLLEHYNKAYTSKLSPRILIQVGGKCFQQGSTSRRSAARSQSKRDGWTETGEEGKKHFSSQWSLFPEHQTHHRTRKTGGFPFPLRNVPVN